MTQDFYIDGHKLAALRLNPAETPGQPVILLHGIGGSVRFWGDDQTQPFREQGPCYALSLPGHYPAAFPAGFRQEQLTAALIADLTAQAIGELVGDRPVTLIGMSTGGFTALAVAARAPQMVSRVISVSGFCQGRWTGVLGLGQTLVRLGRIGRSLFKYLYRGPRITVDKFADKCSFYASDAKAMHAYPYCRACAEASYSDFLRLNLDELLFYFAVMPGIDICGWLPRITAPTLVMAGDRDPIVPPAQARRIQAGVPHADLEMIKGGGHMLFAERPQEYQRVLRRWLAGHSVSD